MQISIIIPTYNEASTIQKTLNHILSLVSDSTCEIIVCDSPDSDEPLAALDFGKRVTFVTSPQAGRAVQMNYAASISSGQILYFVHADTQIHADFESDLINAVAEGVDLGCYRFMFDRYPTPLLYINSFCTRLDRIYFRGGDQSLFIKRSVFEEINGFCEDLLIMEDYEILQRTAGKFRFKIIPKNVIVSSRKYNHNGYFKVQLANLKVMRMFMGGKHSQQEMTETYKRLLNIR